MYPKFLKAKEKNDFYLSSDAGDDLFSQLDYIAKDNAVAEFKENALNSFQFWADSDNEKESLQQIGKIFDEIEKIQKNKWIEQGNDEKDFRFTHIDSDVISQYTVEAEAAFYGMDVSDYNFDNIVEKVLIELKEKEIEKSEPQNLKELVSQIQQSRVVDEFEADVSDDAELEL